MARQVETSEYGQMVKRMIRAYSRRVADGDEIELNELVAMREVVEQAIGDAVTGQREQHGRSWADVAKGLGVTRQAAQMRYATREAVAT